MPSPPATTALSYQRWLDLATLLTIAAAVRAQGARIVTAVNAYVWAGHQLAAE